jgi:uncharacterized protein HemY
VELEAVMKKEPNRFRTLLLAARAAASAGDTDVAGAYYRRLADLCPKGDADLRPELREARGKD